MGYGDMTDAAGYSSSSSSDCESDGDDGVGGSRPAAAPLVDAEDNVNNALSLVDDDTSCLIIQPPPMPEMDEGRSSHNFLALISV